MRTTLLKIIITLQFSCLLAVPGGLLIGGRGGTPGQTHLTHGNSEINQDTNNDEGNVIENLLPRKEYRKISAGPSYPIKRQDFYNYNNDYDYPEQQEEDPRHLSQDSIKQPNFNIPNDFKSNFGNFNEFFKDGGFADDNSKENQDPQQQQQQDYGYQPEPEEKPTFTRPQPVYVPKEESPEKDYGFDPENADFRYKEESLYPEFKSQQFQFENYRDEGRSPEYDDDFNFDFPKTEFEEFQEVIKKERPLIQEEESDFEESPPYPEPKDFPREIIKYDDPQFINNPQENRENPALLYNPIDSSSEQKKKTPYHSSLKPLSTNLHTSHQLIQIPSIDDRFHPIAKDTVPVFTGFDNNQEIITAPPFPKRRFVNSLRGHTFDVKLGAGFNTGDGTPLDTETVEPHYTLF
ncbi:unnamed protein product [Lepeophtheirus salmonis]|uniref:(salmon louse) hypothetical protein n=1 Tax=Lepeophtheirus salmonis TaxID=72036 RepID=A0A7R8CRC9_LEPSM|nr:unnamed protein product [Lepeophtheirus salmonis]CAF2901767.1 unnamed protein product [Lepeophtheirus salmonis]